MPHDGWDGYFGALIFFTALQWGAALGRFGTRIGIVKRIGPDDIALFITLVRIPESPKQRRAFT